MLTGNEITEKIKDACKEKDSALLSKITIEELYPKLIQLEKNFCINFFTIRSC